MRKAFLKTKPKCEANLLGCTKEATDIHHKAGRNGFMLQYTAYFLACCRHCHNWIETHPAHAKAMGLSLPRVQITLRNRTTYAPEEHAA